jgi:beta-lactamase regulating signal transducer with metallopeptidase domain
MNAWLDFGLSNAVAATLLALVAALATRFCRRPQVVLVLWLLVLAKLLAPPIVGLPAVSLRTYLPWEPVPSSIDAATFDVSAEAMLAAEKQYAELLSQEQLAALQLESDRASLADAALAPLRSTWLPRAVFWTWVTGSALWFAIAAARIARFARLIGHAEEADPALQTEVRQLAEQMGISSVPQVRVARRRVPPLVWGMSGKTTLLLPAELLEGLLHEQRATLLAHELAHVARRDDLVRWFELLAIGLYWWHPVAWWARYNAEAAQEQCCDARVMSLLPHCARAYAETLLATIEFLAEPGRKVPLGASGFSQVGHMHRRLTMILKRNTTGRMSWTMTASLAALGFLVLPVSLHTLWAEPAPESEVEAAAEALEGEVIVDGDVELFVDFD